MNYSLLSACRQNNTDLAINLINKSHPGVINQIDDAGMTSLMYSCINNNEDILKSLLRAGANINLQDKFGCSALIWSFIHNNNINIIDLLIKNNINMNLQDIYGNTALLWSCYIKNNTNISLFLIKNGANVLIENKFGKDPLYYAQISKNKQVASEIKNTIKKYKRNVVIELAEIHKKLPIEIIGKIADYLCTSTESAQTILEK